MTNTVPLHKYFMELFKILTSAQMSTPSLSEIIPWRNTERRKPTLPGVRRGGFVCWFTAAGGLEARDRTEGKCVRPNLTEVGVRRGSRATLLPGAGSGFPGFVHSATTALSGCGELGAVDPSEGTREGVEAAGT